MYLPGRTPPETPVLISKVPSALAVAVDGWAFKSGVSGMNMTIAPAAGFVPTVTLPVTGDSFSPEPHPWESIAGTKNSNQQNFRTMGLMNMSLR